MKKTFLYPVQALLLLLPFQASAQSVSHDEAVNRNLTIFNTIVKELEMNYVDSIRPKEAFDAAVNAFLSTVDPYTEYYSSDDRDELTKLTTGQYEYGGIGSFIMERDGSTYLSTPMEGAPAAMAGLRAGDQIIKVDSVDTSKKGSSEVTKLLRGVAGTPVQITVKRPFVTDSILTFDLTRAKLTEPAIPYSDVIYDNIGYIKLDAYTSGSGKEVKKSLESFKNNGNVEAIVLDLRGNGGGLLEEAVDILGNFLPKGTEVLRTRGKDTTSEKIYKTTHSPIYPDIPLAVLIDGGSASAAEITAGALQDLDRAVLIGNRSFGKGLVQSTRPLPYNGLLKVTVAKYYIPSGRLIQALDYSRRNPDGSVARTPDSLTNIYKTANGREVRDGGGLNPDIIVEWDGTNMLTYNLVRDNWIHDFATKYANTHDTMAPAWDFEVTDEIFDEFKESIDPSKLKYDKVLDNILEDLRECAKDNGYLTEETQKVLDELTPLLTHNLNHDLDTRRDDISYYLGADMASRYYYDKGRIIQELKHDKTLEKAREILSDKNQLNTILGKGTKK